MRFDTNIEYFNESKELLGSVLGNFDNLGAEKQKDLFSVANAHNLKEKHVVIVVDCPIPIRSGYLKVDDQNFTILKVIGSTIYGGEYRGKL